MDKLFVMLGLTFAYYAIPEKRLVDMKILFTWIGLLALLVSHLHSIYRLLTSSDLDFWMKVVALNISVLAIPVLLGVAYVFKKFLREILERSN